MSNDRFDLLKMKLEILKLKADDYNWQCHVPKKVKEDLDSMLAEIDKSLEELK